MWLLLPVLTLAAATAQPQITIKAPQNVDAELMTRQVATIQNYLTPELWKIITEAAVDPDTWERVMKDPAAFLAEKEMPLPDGLSVAIEVPGRLAGPYTYPVELVCPYGLNPVEITQVVQKCGSVIKFWSCSGPPDDTICILVAQCLDPYYELETHTMCALCCALGH